MDAATASEILGLMDEILEEVFQSPARVARRKQQRLEREQRQKEGSDQSEEEDQPILNASAEIIEIQYSDEPPF